MANPEHIDLLTGGRVLTNRLILDPHDAATQFAKTPQGWLVLAGGNGCGKTHLAVAIAKQCLDQGATVLFAIVPDLLDVLRSTFSPPPHAGNAFDEEFRTMREVEVLILDDLGAEQGTPWAMEKLFQLLNYRYNARLATVFTTNKVGLEGIAPRLRSRMSDRRLTRIVTLADAQDVREMELDMAAQVEAPPQDEHSQNIPYA
ncbi:MAG: ATP-binding protein [Ktedonobacteraceae bacterium]